MTDQTPPLLPCPFCGNKAIVVEQEHDRETWSVRCNDGCDAHVWNDSPTSAIAAWNVRAAVLKGGA